MVCCAMTARSARAASIWLAKRSPPSAAGPGGSASRRRGPKRLRALEIEAGVLDCACSALIRASWPGAEEQLVVADDGDDVARLDGAALLDPAGDQRSADAGACRNGVAALHLAEYGLDVVHGRWLQTTSPAPAVAGQKASSNAAAARLSAWSGPLASAVAAREARVIDIYSNIRNYSTHDMISMLFPPPPTRPANS